MSFFRPPRTFGLIILATSLVLTGCGGSKDEGKKAGQTVARVDGEEITVHQVNEELMQMGVAQAQQEQATKQALDVLVDRQLLEKAARKAKLDRNPNILQAIEREKSQILAQAYIQSKMTYVAEPTAAEVSEYFKQHPEYFTQRKLFALQEITIAITDFSDEAKSMVDVANSLDEVAAWLNERGILFAKTATERSSTDLAPELVKQLLSMQVGSIVVIKLPDRVMVAALESLKDAPLSVSQAKPQIEQFLLNKKRKEAGEAEIARLRASAKIEYLNETASTAAKPAAQDKPAVAEPASATEVNPAGAADSYIERGPAGLE